MAGDKASVKAAAAPTPTVTPSVVMVTQATHNDISDICALFKRVWDEYKGKLPEELLKTWEPSPLEFTSWMEGVTYFAARREKKLVGIVACTPNDGAVQIEHLAVDPENRRQDVGTSLVNAAIEWSRRSSANSVWVETLEVFSGAIHLFQKLGFQPCGELHRHFWKQDVHIFEKVI
ncbi:MAG: GNAT family N-acetyltransferase [Euryarchaeota archaeon]|nr:GNAT family N-acetyltransferase [Euryarchaeota archaeon]